MKNSIVCFVMATAGVIARLCTMTEATEPMHGVISVQQAAPQGQAVAGETAPPEPKASPEQQAAAEKLGVSVIITNSIEIKLALIPAGEFLMGSPAAEAHRNEHEGPQHTVRITRPFYLGVYEVTVGQFRPFVAATAYRTKAERDGAGGGGWTGKKWEWGKPEFTWQNIGIPQPETYPVVNVSWNDAVAFCQWLSEKEARTYRLPTEAEWEYAIRAGTTTPFHWGAVLNGTEANCDGTHPYGTEAKGQNLRRPTRVGSYAANGLGLYDMHGNVLEWCQDWYDAEYSANSPTKDPTGPAEGSLRVLRGGSWHFPAAYCRTASRFGIEPDFRGVNLGFRVASDPSGQ
jgi:formylglycine-generating enzyme required for sulfatase activity